MSASLRVCVLATRSSGKVRELLPLLKAHGWSPLTLDEAGVVYDEAEEQIEVHDSFEANALAKARYYAARVPYPVFADDSGLAVDALHGAPGVYSKRWCGRDDLNGDALDAANNAHLLKALELLRKPLFRANPTCWLSVPTTLRASPTCPGFAGDAVPKSVFLKARSLWGFSGRFTWW